MTSLKTYLVIDRLMIMLRSSTRSEILLRRRGMKDVQIMVAQEYQTRKTDVKRDLTKIPRILALGPLKNQREQENNTII